MSLETIEKYRGASNAAPELDHWWCCDEDVAMCGTDISGMGGFSPRNPRCLVCEESFVCVECGQEYEP